MTYYHAYADELQFLTFTAQTGSRLWRDPPEGSYLLLYPHWYRTDARRALVLVGKTRVRACQAPVIPVEIWRAELETLLDGELAPEMRGYAGRFPMVVIFDPVAVAQMATSGPTCFPPCSYVLIDPFLYRTDRHACLQVMTQWSMPKTATPEELCAELERRTGITPEQIHSVVYAAGRSSRR